MPARYSIGQPVTCILFEGPWIIKKIINCEFYTRYELRQGDRYEKDIPEIWLEPIHLTLAIDNDRMIA